MAGPWERYQNTPQTATGGPWERYGAGAGAVPTVTTQGADEKGSRLPTQIGSAGIPGTFVHGRTLGFSDEILGTMTGLADTGLAAIGLDPDPVRGPAVVEQGDGITTATMGAPTGEGRPIGERISEGIANENRALQQARDENPVLGTAAELAGGAGSLGARGMFNFGRTTGRRALATGAEGAVVGTVAGAGYAEGGIEDRARGAATGAVLGFGFGAALPTAANAVLDRLGARKLIREAPDGEELARQARTLFERAENSGAYIDRGAGRSFVAAMGRELTDEGISPTLHKSALGVWQEVASEMTTRNLGFKDIQRLRRMLKTAASSTTPELADERRIANIMVNRLDEFVEGLQPGDLAGGTAQQAAQAADDLTQARGLWGRMRRSEMIDEAVRRADLAASGIENGLRNEFRSILKNKKLLRGFSDAEIEAMERVAKGTLAGNAMRQAGRFSFGTGGQSNALGGAIGLGAGIGVGGPLGAAIPISAALARMGSKNSTIKNSDLARALVLSGPDAQVASPRGSVLADVLARRPVGVASGQMSSPLAEALRERR